MSATCNLDSPRTPNPADAQLESALTLMTLDELSCLQDTLHEQLRGGLPAIGNLVSVLERHNAEVAGWLRLRTHDNGAVEVVMLLGALAVAIAWMTHRHVPAPARTLHDAIATVCEDHLYMLPIPRNDPCFCGSGGRFRGCHGKVPSGASMVASARVNH